MHKLVRRLTQHGDPFDVAWQVAVLEDERALHAQHRRDCTTVQRDEARPFGSALDAERESKVADDGYLCADTAARTEHTASFDKWKETQIDSAMELICAMQRVCAPVALGFLDKAMGEPEVEKWPDLALSKRLNAQFLGNVRAGN